MAVFVRTESECEKQRPIPYGIQEIRKCLLFFCRPECFFFVRFDLVGVIEAVECVRVHSTSVISGHTNGQGLFGMRCTPSACMRSPVALCDMYNPLRLRSSLSPSQFLRLVCRPSDAVRSNPVHLLSIYLDSMSTGSC